MTSYDYDPHDRVTATYGPNGTYEATYVYDADSNLTSVTYHDGSTTRTWTTSYDE